MSTKESYEEVRYIFIFVVRDCLCGNHDVRQISGRNSILLFAAQKYTKYLTHHLTQSFCEMLAF